LIFYQSKTTRITKPSFVLYKKPEIKVVGYFQKNDHLYFAENFEESGFIFAPLKVAKRY
jgi:isochorismate synthase